MAPVSRVPSVDDPGDQSVRWEAPQVLVTWPLLPGVTWPGWLIWGYGVLQRPCCWQGRSQWPGQWNLPQDFTCWPYGQLWPYQSVAVNWWVGRLSDWLPLLKAEDNSLANGIIFFLTHLFPAQLSLNIWLFLLSQCSLSDCFMSSRDFQIQRHSILTELLSYVQNLSCELPAFAHDFWMLFFIYR